MSVRLDQLLVERGFVDSRSQAQRVVKEGRVEANFGTWQLVSKSSLKLDLDTPIRIIEDESDLYVSRGALKLKGAHQRFNLSFHGKVAIDVGQSTGGFTDYLLQQGAARVIGIEVGHDQLAKKLREDPRVICIEGYNARNLAPELIEHSPSGHFDFAVMDVSFISQTLILPGLIALLSPGSWLITLVKPQFELGPEHIGRGGLVKSTHLYAELQGRMQSLVTELGMDVEGYIPSPIKGGDGNQEFILAAKKRPASP